MNDLALSRVESNAFLNTGFQHLRYNYAYRKRWTGEAFAQTQYNKPLRLDLRTTLGAGPRLRIFNEDEFRMHIGTALMLEYGRVTSGEAFIHGRNSSYLSGTVRFNKKASITTVVYYQPRIFSLGPSHRVGSGFPVLAHSALHLREPLESIARYGPAYGRTRFHLQLEQPVRHPFLITSCTCAGNGLPSLLMRCFSKILLVVLVLNDGTVAGQGGIRAIFWDLEKAGEAQWVAGYGLGYDQDLNKRLSLAAQFRYGTDGAASHFQFDYRTAYHLARR